MNDQNLVRMLSSKTLIASILMVIGHFLNLPAQESAFRQANLLFEDEAYERAAQIYDSLIEAGTRSQALFYNAGNAYLKINDHASAILHFEKALALGEKEDIRGNLKLAEEMITEPIARFSDFFLYRWWGGLLALFGPNGYAILSVLTFITGLFILYRHWFKKSMEGPSGWLAGGLLVLAVIFVLLSTAAKSYSEQRVYAIVMVESADLFEASDQRSDKIRDLAAGVKVRYVDRIGSWVKVQLPDRDEGWIEEGEIELIE